MMLFVGPPKKQNIDVDPNAKKEKTVMEQVQQVAKELKVTLREHTHNPVESEKKKQSAAMLEAETSAAVVRMKQNCQNCFDEVYQAYIHLKMLRFSIDQSMRFGQAEPTLMCMLKPKAGTEKKLQTRLIDMFLDDHTQRGITYIISYHIIYYLY